MITLVWHWDSKFSNYNAMTHFSMDEFFEHHMLLAPTIVRTRKEMDYLLGMQLMYSVTVDLRLSDAQLNEAERKTATYFPVKGLA